MSLSLIGSESRGDLYAETTNSSSNRSEYIPPISVTSSTILKNSLNQKATVYGATIDDECISEGIIKSPDPHDSNLRKGVRLQDILPQGDDRGEDLEPPSKKVKILATTWTYTSPPDTLNYMNKRTLELSRVTRRAFAAEIRYQRLRSHELDLMKSLVDSKIEQIKTQINAVDVQISAIEGMLRDAEVDIESKEGKLSEDNIRMLSGDDHDSEANWQENDSGDVTNSFVSGY
ncbi:hypothetical protein BDR04DRAFT_185527 [Suillus decipiens]|nr:hypothetical protein BDR04DRAFT_185527 [Suillus decipiens]